MRHRVESLFATSAERHRTVGGRGKRQKECTMLSASACATRRVYYYYFFFFYYHYYYCYYYYYYYY
eukprot:11745291-Prorocentrum_lima.AAC.1